MRRIATMAKRKWILMVTAGELLAVGGGLAWHWWRGEPDNVLIASGTIEATEVDVSFKIAGRVIERPVDEGDRVEPGTLIAHLESRELEAQVDRAHASLQSVWADLREAKALMQNAEVDFRRMDYLYKEGGISEQIRDAALITFLARTERHNAAQAAIDRDRAALAEAETRLGYTVLRSQQAGVVLRKHVEPGEMIAAGTPAVTTADLRDIWLKIYIPQPQLGRIKLGQAAEITTDSYPGKIYRGKVTFINSEAEFTPKNVQTQEERVKLVFAAKITVKNPNQELKPGMPADAKVQLDSRELLAVMQGSFAER